MKKRKLMNTSITIYEDQSQWLESHREINLSATVRKLIDEKIKSEV